MPSCLWGRTVKYLDKKKKKKTLNHVPWHVTQQTEDITVWPDLPLSVSQMTHIDALCMGLWCIYSIACFGFPKKITICISPFWPNVQTQVLYFYNNLTHMEHWIFGSVCSCRKLFTFHKSNFVAYMYHCQPWQCVYQLHFLRMSGCVCVLCVTIAKFGPGDTYWTTTSA